MAYSETDLHREVRTLVRADLASGNAIIRGWLINKVLSTHVLPRPLKEEEKAQLDYEFNLLCRQLAVVEAVRDVLARLKLRSGSAESAGSTGDLPFPGYKHLQLGYFVEREGENQLVPTVDLTDDEGEERAKLFEKLGKGCFAHADEMRRFLAHREPPESAAA